MKIPNEQIVVGMGELLWDEFDGRRSPGGAPANVAFHAAQLGYRGVLCSRVGSDPPGTELLEYLRSHGLDTTYVQLDSRRPTGRVTVDTSDPSSPSYTIHEDVAWDALQFEDRLERLVRSCAAICVGTLAQRETASRRTIQRALAATGDALVVFDVNLRAPWYDLDSIQSTLERCDVVKLNEAEVAVLAPLLSLSPVPLQFATGLRDRHQLDLVCITRGSDGCLIVGNGESVDIPGVNVEVADAVGAGDAFTAALISARLRGWSADRCGRFANRVGAEVASRQGAMPALGPQIARLMAQADSEAMER